MRETARYALRVVGLVAALGLSTLTGQAVASADDGAGSPAAKAEADEIRDMTHLVQSAQDSTAYQEQMFDLVAEMAARE